MLLNFLKKMAKGGDGGGFLMIIALLVLLMIPFFGSGNQTVQVPLEVKEEYRKSFFSQFMNKNHEITTEDFGFDPTEFYRYSLYKQGYNINLICELKKNTYVCTF